jgi:hypothetical protein
LKDEDYVAALQSHLLEQLIEVLSLSGIQLSLEEIADKATKAFGSKLASLSRDSVALHRIIGIEMSTSDFTVICPRYKDIFEPDIMEDMDAGGPERDMNLHLDGRVSIVCTTDLGLCRHSKKANLKGEEATLEESILLKAKVVMPSMLDSGAPGSQANQRD